ncbi:hypothetical protein ACWD0J_29895 [Streptomyces sp. NPDC003011]
MAREIDLLDQVDAGVGGTETNTDTKVRAGGTGAWPIETDKQVAQARHCPLIGRE